LRLILFGEKALQRVMSNFLGHYHIGSGEHAHVRPNELLPRCRATPLRRWRDVVPPQDVAHRSIRDSMTQIGQCTHDAVISGSWHILPSQTGAAVRRS
jgi:hypothetical protein